MAQLGRCLSPYLMDQKPKNMPSKHGVPRSSRGRDATDLARDFHKHQKIVHKIHVFRRGSCIHQVRSGLSNKVIQYLGGWETPNMVSHYAQSLTFDEALELYKSVNP
ncbi:tyrosine-type recombinase/integrase [Chloroflexota bacterium]